VQVQQKMERCHAPSHRQFHAVCGLAREVKRYPVTKIFRTCFRQAVNFYNRYQRRVWLQKILRKESHALQEDTRAILRTCELLEDLPE